MGANNIADAIAALEGVVAARAVAPEAALVEAAAFDDEAQPTEVAPPPPRQEPILKEKKAEPPAEVAAPAVEEGEAEPEEEVEDNSLEEQLREARAHEMSLMHMLNASAQGLPIPGFDPPKPQVVPPTPAAYVRAEQPLAPQTAAPSPSALISDEEYIDMISSTEGKKHFERTIMNAVQLARQQMLTEVVPTINRALDARAAIGGFFSQAENSDIAPLSGYVTRLAGQLGDKDPTLNFNTAMVQAANIVRQSVGIKQRGSAVASAVEKKQEALTPPRRFARGADARPARQGKEAPQNEIARQIAEFEKLEQ